MNILISSVTALFFSDDGAYTRQCDIYIRNGIIESITDCPEGFVADKIICGSDKLAIPGLVNSHTHSYMSVLRNCADDLPFNEWLFKRILPLEDKLSPEDQYYGTLLGICEMLKSGTTSFLDMYIAPEMAAKAVIESGVRAVISRGLVGESASDEGGHRRLREARDDIKCYSGAANGRLTFMLAPHAPYTCAPDFLSLVAKQAQELSVGIHTHVAESKNETEQIREKYGCTPVEYMLKAGVFDVHTAAAHCVQLSESDIDILRDKNVYAVTNPASNMKLGNGIAPVPKLIDAGVCVALGTDSAASNNNLNMLRELGLLTLIHKGATQDATCLSAEMGLKMATLNGALALGLENIGEIRTGYRADISLLDLNCPQMNPRSDCVSAMAYSANGSEVETVIVDGEILMENRELKTIEEQRVIYEANRIYQKING